MEGYKCSSREIINEIGNNNGKTEVESAVFVEEKSNRTTDVIHEEKRSWSFKKVYTPGCSTTENGLYNDNTLERNYSQDKCTTSDLDRMEDSCEFNVTLPDNDNDNEYKKIDGFPKRYAVKSIQSIRKECDDSFATHHRPNLCDPDKNRSRGTCANSSSGETDCCTPEVSSSKGHGIDEDIYDIVKRYTEESKHSTLKKYTNFKDTNSAGSHCRRLQNGLDENSSLGTCTNSSSGETDCCESEVFLKGYNIDKETYDILKRYTDESRHLTMKKYTIYKHNNNSVESPQPQCRRLQSGLDEYTNRSRGTCTNSGSGKTAKSEVSLTVYDDNDSNADIYDIIKRYTGETNHSARKQLTGHNNNNNNSCRSYQQNRCHLQSDPNENCSRGTQTDCHKSEASLTRYNNDSNEEICEIIKRYTGESKQSTRKQLTDHDNNNNSNRSHQPDHLQCDSGPDENYSRGAQTNPTGGKTGCSKPEQALQSLTGYNCDSDEEFINIIRRCTGESKHSTQKRYANDDDNNSLRSLQPNYRPVQSDSGLDERRSRGAQTNSADGKTGCSKPEQVLQSLTGYKCDSDEEFIDIIRRCTGESKCSTQKRYHHCNGNDNNNSFKSLQPNYHPVQSDRGLDANYSRGMQTNSAGGKTGCSKPEQVLQSLTGHDCDSDEEFLDVIRRCTGE